MSKWGRKKERPPPGFDALSPTLNALEREMRAKMNEPHEGKRKVEMLWPIHQINNQRSRYVYDMFYVHKRVSRSVYDYCVRQKLVDAELIAKWKKPGYDRLCSTFAINTRNYPYGTVSICRVPRQFLRKGQIVQDSHSGCRGCSSGKGGYHNIFGNKYGQRLAAIQVMREKMASGSSDNDGAGSAAAGVGAGEAGDEARGSGGDGGGGSGGKVWATGNTAAGDTIDDINEAGGGDVISEENGPTKGAPRPAPPDVSANAQAALSAWQEHGSGAFTAGEQMNGGGGPSSKRARLR